ncbi:MAG: hypothetical protein K6E42_07355 [Synergistes sp.]|nr:hypothetical protein [Synergistes sp.]
MIIGAEQPKAAGIIVTGCRSRSTKKASPAKKERAVCMPVKISYAGFCRHLPGNRSKILFQFLDRSSMALLLPPAGKTDLNLFSKSSGQTAAPSLTPKGQTPPAACPPTVNERVFAIRHGPPPGA